MQKQKAVKVMANADSEIESERELEEADFMTCPIMLKKVDPTIMIPNLQMVEAINYYLDNNPWSFEFDPRDKFEDIKVWQ